MRRRKATRKIRSVAAVEWLIKHERMAGQIRSHCWKKLLRNKARTRKLRPCTYLQGPPESLKASE